MRFESWVHATVRCSILSLMWMAQQAPDRIQFKPDEDLSDWLNEGCNVEFRSARLEPYTAVLATLYDLKVPYEKCTGGPGSDGKSMHAMTVVGPCDEQIIDKLIADFKLMQDGQHDVKLKWKELENLDTLLEKLDEAIASIIECMELIEILAGRGELAHQFKAGVDKYVVKAKDYFNNIRNYIKRCDNHAVRRADRLDKPKIYDHENI